MVALLNNAKFSGEVLDHLGLVAATIEKVDLIKKIDQHLPVSKEKGAKITMGERVSAMIMNGLGFVDDRLYLFPEFLRNKPINALFNRPVDPDHFNDDALGRCLDAISDYGVTKLFTEIALDIGIEQNLLGKAAHFDTSTLSVYGDYPEEENTESSQIEGFNINYGYSKAHRPDLKQAVINLATSGKAGFPVWMEAHSGNASDQTVLKKATKRMKEFCAQLKGAPDFIYVADSAGYSGFLKHGASMPWLTRVPERIKDAKGLVSQSENDFIWENVDDNYKICCVYTQSGGVRQRWLLVHSSHAEKRELKTLERNIKKENILFEQEFKRLGRQSFDCSKDAEKSAQAFIKKLKYHRVEISIEAQQQYVGKGRPKKGQAPEITGYAVHWTLCQDPEKIIRQQNRKGRFILGSNVLDQKKLSDKEMLTEYKNQSKTESGFKFIKNDAFEVDSIFLKKESRIPALMMVMTLCLMIYGVAQHHLRTTLIEKQEMLPNQKRVDTQKPSMQWIFRLFQGVQRLTITSGDETEQCIINLNDTLKQIIRYFGPRAMAIYQLSPE